MKSTPRKIKEQILVKGIEDFNLEEEIDLWEDEEDLEKHFERVAQRCMNEIKEYG